jgi:hypothetical protein
MSGSFGCLGALLELLQLLVEALFGPERPRSMESGSLPADQRPYDGYSQDNNDSKNL